MAICTMNELAQSLGDGYDVKPLDQEQARILVDGGDIAFIDIETGGIETELSVMGYLPGEEPDLDAARSLIEWVRDEWSREGFTVDDQGRIGEHWYLADPETKYPRVVFDASQSVDQLEDALRVLAWVRDAETQFTRP